MKKSTDKFSITMRTIEKDLKALFQSEDNFTHEPAGSDLKTSISLAQALQIFDESKVPQRASKRLTRESVWTHPSVLALNDPDPVSGIVARARRLVLDAIENGWSGPPYNPFSLAEMQRINLLPTEDVLDAQTRSDSAGRFTISFNPRRPAARMRYSVAHELGHTLFPDCAAATRNRCTHQDMKDDDWQLESLCNIAAAEILMPFGTLQEELSIRPSVGLILDLRRKYAASCEAVLNRVMRLTSYPCAAFLTRLDNARSRYFVEYCISSPALQKELSVNRGYVLPPSSEVASCAAIGARAQEDVRWISGQDSWFVEYLGISSNTGEICPRVIGIAFPPLVENFSADEHLRFLKGDASEPFGTEPKLLLQLVNDQAQVWGGGFAKQARKKWPQAQADFRRWTYGRRNLRLGNIHSIRVRPDLTLVSLVSQRGFGSSNSGPRLRYGSLYLAMEKTAELARSQCASVHMPRVGTGQAGGSWNIVEGIIRETLISSGVNVTVYDLPSRSSDFPRQASIDFVTERTDEVM